MPALLLRHVQSLLDDLPQIPVPGITIPEHGVVALLRIAGFEQAVAHVAGFRHLFGEGALGLDDGCIDLVIGLDLDDEVLAVPGLQQEVRVVAADGM